MEIFTYIGIAWAVMMILKLLVARAEIRQTVDLVRAEADRRIRVVKLEPVPDKGLILAFDDENHDFLGQGTSDEEVKQRIIERFPEKIFLLNDKVFSALKLEGIKQ
jgi:Cu2+-containing amine oxidase